LFVEQALESPVAEKHQKQQKALDAIRKYRKKIGEKLRPTEK